MQTKVKNPICNWLFLVPSPTC